MDELDKPQYIWDRKYVITYTRDNLPERILVRGRNEEQAVEYFLRQGYDDYCFIEPYDEEL